MLHENNLETVSHSEIYLRLRVVVEALFKLVIYFYIDKGVWEEDRSYTININFLGTYGEILEMELLYSNPTSFDSKIPYANSSNKKAAWKA